MAFLAVSPMIVKYFDLVPCHFTISLPLGNKNNKETSNANEEQYL